MTTSGGADVVPPPTTPAPATPPVVKRRRSRGAIVAVAVIVIVIVAGLAVAYEEKWFPGQKSSSSTVCSGVSLQGNGAQFVAPLMSAWTTAYDSATSNMVNYVAGGSGTGLTDFSEHPPILDFAVTDDPLTSAEVSAMPAQPLTIPMVGGALTIIYNLPGLTGHLNLTGALLVDIYNGTITRWNSGPIQSVNPGVTLPNATIVPVVRSDPAGTTYVLTDFLSQSSAWWASASGPGKGISIDWPKVTAETAAKGNSAVLSTVEKTSYAIGYSDLTDVLNTPSLQYAAIENPKGNYIVPTIADTASAIADQVATLPSIPASVDASGWYNVSMVNAPGASDYPLATFVYIYVYQATDKGFPGSAGPPVTQERAEVLVQWLQYILSATGQAMANETSPTQLYYTALPASVVSVDEAGIQTMTFNGAAIPACT